MRVISNHQAEVDQIEVTILSGDHQNAVGIIIGHNGHALKNGRKYSVRLADGAVVMEEGGNLKRPK